MISLWGDQRVEDLSYELDDLTQTPKTMMLTHETVLMPTVGPLKITHEDAVRF